MEYRTALATSLFILVATSCLAGCRDAEGAPGAGAEQGPVRDAAGVDLSAVPAALLYPGAEARGRFAQETGEQQGVSYVLEVGQSPPRVIAYYDAITALPRQSKKETPSGTMFEFHGKNERELYTVTIAPSTGKTGITILLSERD